MNQPLGNVGEGARRRSVRVNATTLDGLDELDRRIVVALQHDGRASWRAIADLVNSSTATVARRG